MGTGGKAGYLRWSKRLMIGSCWLSAQRNVRVDTSVIVQMPHPEWRGAGDVARQAYLVGVADNR
jgi:hypothetical protein